MYGIESDLNVKRAMPNCRSMKELPHGEEGRGRRGVITSNSSSLLYHTTWGSIRCWRHISCPIILGTPQYFVSLCPISEHARLLPTNTCYVYVRLTVRGGRGRPGNPPSWKENIQQCMGKKSPRLKPIILTACSRGMLLTDMFFSSRENNFQALC